jgi:hypothetical protein
VLARWAGLAVEELVPEAEPVIDECGNLPLALAMIGAQLKRKPAGHWEIVLRHLRRADLAKVTARFPEPHTTLLRAIQVSFEALRDEDPIAARRYLELAVLLEDMVVVPVVQQALWNVDEWEALETADRFVGLSLAKRDADGGGIRLHDLQLDFVRAQYPNPKALELVRAAVRLSAHVIKNDPQQFASQMAGRLLAYRDRKAIREFVERIGALTLRPWLRPLGPCLTAPGTGLIRVLTGHHELIFSVALSADGKVAVSASTDGTVRVWKVGSGQELRTLKRQGESMLSGDGKVVFQRPRTGQ